MAVTIAAPILHPLMAVIPVGVMAVAPTVVEMEEVIDHDHARSDWFRAGARRSEG